MQGQRTISESPHRWFAAFAAWVVVAALSVAGVLVVPADAGAHPAKQLYNQGEFEQAKQQAYGRDDAKSMVLRSRFAVWEGDDEDARRFADAAVEVAADGEQARLAHLEQARLKWLYGQRDEAIDQARELLGDAPDDPQIRFELGRMLMADGDVEQGRTVLEAVARRYNDGMFDSADELVWVGRAMMQLESPRDANRAFSRAVREDGEYLEAHIRLGELMLDWHNAAEAEDSFRRVLADSADHPEALAGLALVQVQRQGRFVEAMELVEQAKDAYSGHPRVKQVHAHLLIAQGQWTEGQQVAEAFLDRAPQDGQMLSLAAAAALLRGDNEGFAAMSERFDDRRSDRADLLAVAGEFAALNNRHRQAVTLFEKALQREEDHRGALAGLGLALTRTGQEADGVPMLQRAFDEDQYQLPVYNMLQLYERGLDDYVTDEVEGFRLRAEASQFELVRRITEPLVGEAMEVFEKRYGIELPSLTLEVYDDSESFSVRSTGLVHVDPHGICFGPVVLMRSPRDQEVNWSMVLWHEIAHSFHLELSDERVPLWFTEGLAEYETRRNDESWTRFGDVSIARRIQYGQMWSIGELNEAFMSAGAEDINEVYQTAMLVMAYLHEEYGLESVVEMLGQFADTPQTEETFEKVLGEPMDRIEQGFEEWLQRHYAGLLHQTLVDWPRLRAMVEGDEVEHAGEAEAMAFRALVAAMRGDEQAAQVQLSNLARQNEPGDQAQIVAVLARQVLGEADEALQKGRAVIDGGVESFELRYALARIAADAGEKMEAYVHAVAATTLAPYNVDAWRQLEERAEAVERETSVRRAKAGRFHRDVHNATLARRISSLLLDDGAYDGAMRAAGRWTEIAPTDAQAHLRVADAAVKLERFEEALDAYRRAVAASPGRSDEIIGDAVETFRAAGAGDYARRLEDDDDL